MNPTQCFSMNFQEFKPSSGVQKCLSLKESGLTIVFINLQQKRMIIHGMEMKFNQNFVKICDILCIY